MKLHCIAFLVLFSLFCFHSNGNHTVVNRSWRKVPIVLFYANEAKRKALTPVQTTPSLPTQGNDDEENDEGHFTLHMVIHDVDKHLDYSASSDHLEKVKYTNDTNMIEYIPEDEDPVHKTRRVKRYDHYGGQQQHYGGHQQHYDGHQQQYGGHHGPQMHQRQPKKKPVSLDFGCNSDNHHVTLTKQHDGSRESDRTTSNPSSSSSSSDFNDKLLSLFIRRPKQYHHSHNHGPHITFRCNANNHHIFKHYRRSSK